MDSKKNPDSERHWRTNLTVISILLGIWAIVAYGCSIWFVESLNRIQFMDLPLGFWFANQGSIYVFVVLILVYALVMDRIDRNAKKDLQKNKTTR